MYAIKIRANIDAALLKLLDPTGSAMLDVTKIKKDSWLLIDPENPSANKILTEEEFNAGPAARIAANQPVLVRLNKRA